jgi:hypothetical protein
VEYIHHRKPLPFPTTLPTTHATPQFPTYHPTTLTNATKQTILQSLIEKTSVPTGETSQPPFKYIVNSTVIQHIGVPSEPEKHGRRGMHSAVGAYWNNEKDGTFSYKWAGAEKKGMDIVIAITWVAI